MRFIRLVPALLGSMSVECLTVPCSVFRLLCSWVVALQLRLRDDVCTWPLRLPTKWLALAFRKDIRLLVSLWRLLLETCLIYGVSYPLTHFNRYGWFTRVE